VLGVLPPPAEGAFTAAAVSKSVILAGAGRGADVADVVSRGGGADVADVASRARGVLCLLPPVAGGVLPAAAAVESVLGAAVLPRNTTKTRRSAGRVALGKSRKVALPSCACYSNKARRQAHRPNGQWHSARLPACNVLY